MTNVVPPNKFPQYPRYNVAGITSGTAALGIRYDNGVMIATDTLVTYGSEKAFLNKQRVFKMNENFLLAGSGDWPDFLDVKVTTEKRIVKDFCFDLTNSMRPSMAARFLRNELYQRRMEKRAVSCSLIVGGINHDGSPYLATVDKYGGYFADFVAATGPAMKLARPLVLHAKPPDREFTAAEAENLIRECQSTMFYQCCASIGQFHVGVCSRSKCSVKGPFKVQESWSVAELIPKE